MIASIDNPAVTQQIVFTLPDYFLHHQVPWNNGDYTFVVGMNGSGKTHLLNLMRDWADDNSFTWASYDAVYGIDQGKMFIEEASDEDIIYACKIMSQFSYDFADDISGWGKNKNVENPEKDAELLRFVLRMCGAGYTRLLAITMAVIEKGQPDYYFLDLPETSLHLHIAQNVLGYLMNAFPYTKFVIATHSPDIIQDKWENNNVIEMNLDYMNDCANHKFNEIF